MNLRSLAYTIISLLLLLVCIFFFANYFTGQAYIEQLTNRFAEHEQQYKDSLAFVNGQLELQYNIVEFNENNLRRQESVIDSLTAVHEKTKKKVRQAEIGSTVLDTGFVYAPNEYVNECEQCFIVLHKYKKDNVQLRFERDSYDSLMRMQGDLQANRIIALQKEKASIIQAFAKTKLDSSEVTRKLKFSGMGMLNDLFLPNGGGAGLIYEDKKFNEFGAHILLTTRGNIYLFHIAKTISFKRKK